MTNHDEAAAVVDRFGLQPHPEGGHYLETLRQPAPDGSRALATAILFLLKHGEQSHWHRVDATELWFWHAGSPLQLAINDDVVLLGGNLLAGDLPQATVLAGAWQSAAARDGWALVSCVVTPGFSFDGFELAPPDWSPPPHPR